MKVTAPIKPENLSHAELVEAFYHSQFMVEKLSLEISWLKKQIFGTKTERFVPALQNPSQLPLGIEAEEVAACKVTDAKKITYVKGGEQKPDTSSSHPGRMRLPAHLRREETVIEPAEEVVGMNKIGEDITEILEYLPGELFVKKLIRPKYARIDPRGVVMGALPPRALPKHLFGDSLLAQILIDKYIDHLPLHRQNERFKRAGVNLPSSTLSDAVKGVCQLIEPLGRAHLKEVLDTHYLSVDETPIKVQDRRKKGTTHLGYYWVYFNSLQKIVHFDYRQGRGREGPLEILSDFTGYLQSDAYAAYDIFETRPGVTLLGCMAHARRLYIDALAVDEELATYVLDQMQQLYAIEKEIRDMSVEQKKSIRQERSVPLLQDLGSWMKEKYISLKSQSTGIAKALAYCIQRWDRLSRYTDDGILSIDNNPVERTIRPLALGKKNYLFCGSHEAARRAGILYSLFGTCKLHGINPQEWLTDILTRLPDHPINRITELLPQHWKK